jgi:hypothetical protein
MTSTYMLSELEAVNIILQAADEAPVGSLELSGLFPLDRAKAALSEASRVIQSLGWKFNTEEDYPVTRDGTGQINLPPNMVRLDVDDSFLSSVVPVQRGTRLYDSKAHSYTFTQDLTGTAVFLLAWDELPQAARHYITIRAARILQGRSSISESTYRYSADDETAALLALNEHEAQEGDHNMLRDSWSVAGVLFNREML